MKLEDIKKIKKGELHVHLNGLVNTNVIRELLEKDISKLPSDFNLDKDLNILKPADSLSTYLKPWHAFRLIPKSRNCLKLIIESAFSNLKSNNVTFVEIRNSIIYIATLNKISVEKALRWVIFDIDSASVKYEIRAALILTISRGNNATEHLDRLLKAYKNLNFPECVVGLDLAGNEDVSIPKETSKLFRKAKSNYGFNITIHAGETGNLGNIEEAINEFSADRIGHGTAASNSKSVMALLREKNVCVEVCPISNRLTNAVKEKDAHPVNDFIENEVPFVICSDNPAIHASSISHDYLDFFNETNSKGHLEEMYQNQKKYSFITGLK